MFRTKSAADSLLIIWSAIDQKIIKGSEPRGGWYGSNWTIVKIKKALEITAPNMNINFMSDVFFARSSSRVMPATYPRSSPGGRREFGLTFIVPEKV